MREYSLRGGSVSGVARVGDTVRRRAGVRAGFVHELLGFFQRSGWSGAPRFLGFDERGREILSFIDGGGGAGSRGVGLRPVAFIDWDLAGPGRRIHDVAHVCWQYLGLGPGAETELAARRIRLICDAYRLEGREEIVDVIMWWQDRCWRGIEAGAEAGDPAMAGLRDRGAVGDVRAAWRWVAEHRGELERR